MPACVFADRRARLDSADTLLHVLWQFVRYGGVYTQTFNAVRSGGVFTHTSSVSKRIYICSPRYRRYLVIDIKKLRKNSERLYVCYIFNSSSRYELPFALPMDV
ncbi:hypothetical protein NDU88_005276 [Pleurodeles waltl]|uniref:Uncharacterized protein n=1 Tax=Pleurodeles waltl TaxID=8319 RepID=A0AAV7PFG5_PLEWA|nr:hypothetical protein NDU88_005276 [Pleurodeles waltl]